jgi:hypothetical protein
MEIQNIIAHMVLKEGKTAQIVCVKGNAGARRNDNAGGLAQMAAKKTSRSAVTSVAHLTLGNSEQYRTSKDSLHGDHARHGRGEFALP